MNRLHAPSRNLHRTILASAVACCFAAGLASANPVGPNVTNGQASFATQGKLLTVTNSPGSIINWQGFSIGAGETTRFVQQSAASAVLNRVVGADASSILGALQSNGRVFLVNPNGIIFGAGAVINTAGLVASTLNIMDADFLSGRLLFGHTPGAKAISNAGEIRTPMGGRVLLISAEGVENSGIIRSPKGEVILAAGKSVELTDSSNPEVRVEVSAPETHAVNLGKIIAESGRVGIYGGMVVNRGTVNADSAVVGENGKIVFKASADATLAAGSVTSASGKQGGEIEISSGGTTLVSGEVKATGSAATGGEVRLLGERVGVADSGRVDASGESGGGTVLVGGDLQGANPAVRNSTMTYVGADAGISADAGSSGNGGKIIVWADDTTRSYGNISARGGRQAGDGGLVETSGKRYLEVTRGPDVRGPAGKGGTWLLDPNDLEVVAGSEFNDAINTGAPFFAPLTDSSRIGVDLINAQLDFGSNVVLTTASRGPTAGTQAGNITINAPIIKTATTLPGGPIIGTTNVTLQAHNNIVITPNGSITSTGDPLSVTLTANSDNTGGGGVTIGGSITTRGGSVLVQGSGTQGADLVNVNAPINTLNDQGTFGGTVQLSANSGAVNVTSAVNSGFFSANGKSGVTLTAPIAATSQVQLNSDAGAVTVASNITSTSNVSLTGNKGVRITAGSQIATGQFNSFSASVTDNTSASTLSIEAGALVSSAGASLTSDSMDIQGSVNANGGNISVRQNSAGRAINLGTEVGSALSLTQAELNNFTGVNSFSLGNFSTGDITVAGPVSGSLPSFVNVQSSTAYIQNAGVNVTASLSINAPSITIAAPLTAGSASGLSLTSDNLIVNGAVSSAGNIDIGTRSFGRPIALGISTPSGNALELTSGQLNNLVSPTRVKFNTSGPITIAGPIAPTGTTTLSLSSSNSSITESAGGTVTVQNLALSGRTLIDFQQDNDVTNLSAQISCCSAGNINFVSKPGKLVTVGTVDFISGVTANNFSGNSSLMLQADDMNIVSSVFANLGDIKLLPRSSAVGATLGADIGGTLGLTSAELSLVQANKLTIAADRMDIAAAVSFASANTTLAPATANRPVSIVAAKGNPAELEFVPGELTNIAAGNVIIGGPSAGRVNVNTATTVPGTISGFTLQSADTANGINIAANLSGTNTLGLTTDTLTVGANVSSSNGSIVVAANTAARNIDLGTDPGGSLGLDTTELGRLSAPLGSILFITQAGNINVNAAVTYAGGSAGTVSLDAGGTASVNPSSSLNSPGAVTLRAPTIGLSGPVTAAAGNVTLTGNSINVGAGVSASADINIMPRDFRSIDIGGADVVGSTLGLTQAELTNLSPSGILRIGETSGFTGNINVSAAITLAANRVLSLKTGSGNITQSGAIIIPGGSLAAEASNQITLTQPNQVSTVALLSDNNSVTFVRAPGGAGPAPLAIDQVDDIFGVRSGFGSPISITADRIDINTENSNVFVQGGAVTLQPTAAGAIDIGTKPGGGFGLVQGELDRIFADTLTVGNASSGNITVSQPTNVTTSNNLSLLTGAAKTLTIAPGANLTASSNLTLTAGTLTTAAPVATSFGSTALVADSITLGDTVTSGGSSIAVAPLTPGILVAVGGADVVSTTLGLDSTDLGRLAYGSGSLTLGSAAAGDMTVSYAGTLPGSVSLMTGGQAVFSANTFGATNTLGITANTMSIPGAAGITAGTGVNIATTTPGRSITLGTKPATGLDLDAAELGKISISGAGALAFDTGGSLTTTAPLAFSLVPNVTLSAGTLNHTGGALSAAGNVSLLGDNIPSAGFSTVTSSGGGRITVAPRSFRSMSLGTAPGGSTLGLLPAQIAALSTSGVVQLGDLATASSITIGAPISQPAGSSALAIVANGNISQSAGAGNVITATALKLASNQSFVNLADNNVVGTLAGSSSGSFAFTGTGALTIGTVDGTSGISDNTITLRADSLNIADNILGGTVTLAPRTAGAAIDLGTDTGFGITNVEVNRVTASNLNIGTTSSNASGSITVSSAIDRSFGGSLNLVTAPGSSINVNAGLGSSNTSNVSLNAGAGGVANINAPVQASGAVSVTADTITSSQPITSDFSNVSLSNVGTNGLVTIGGAVNGYFNVSVTGKTITVNAPVNANYPFGSINLGAASGSVGSSVSINQQLTAGGNISIQTDSLAINAPLVTLNSSVTLQPRSAGMPISVGTETAGAFSISANELALITTDSLTIGNTSAGPLTVNAPITSSSLQTLSLQSKNDISQLPTAPIVLSHSTVNESTGFVQPDATLNVVSASGKIDLSADNDINSAVTGQAGGSGQNFMFKNLSPLKIQNLSSELFFAPSGKVIFNAPPGSLILPTTSGSAQSELLAAALGTILEAQDTQKKADEEADKRKEEGEKKDREEQRKKGTQSCS